MRVGRRQFVVGAGAAGAGLLAGCGRLPWQAPPKVPRIGLLSQGSAGPSSRDSLFEGLRDLGYLEGQSLLVEARYTEAQADLLPALAAELVQLSVDVLVVEGGRAILAAKNATTSTPIVMGYTSIDPVAEGLIASLARPGGNITGLTSNVQGAQFGAKRLELVWDALPGIARVAVLWDEGDPVHLTRWGEIQAAGQLLGLQVQSLALHDPADLTGAFEVAADPDEGVDADGRADQYDRVRDRQSGDVGALMLVPFEVSENEPHHEDENRPRQAHVVERPDEHQRAGHQ